jgi:hypothetical protein
MSVPLAASVTIVEFASELVFADWRHGIGWLRDEMVLWVLDIWHTYSSGCEFVVIDLLKLRQERLAKN